MYFEVTDSEINHVCYFRLLLTNTSPSLTNLFLRIMNKKYFKHIHFIRTLLINNSNKTELHYKYLLQ